MNLRYRVELSQSERTDLMQLMSGGKQAARKLKRAQILLAADAGVSDEDIAASIGVGGSTAKSAGPACWTLKPGLRISAKIAPHSNAD